MAALLLTTLVAKGAQAQSARPYESDAATAANSLAALDPIDARVAAKLREHDIELAPLCSDAVFVRRVYLDVIGTMPEPAAIDRFLADARADKRAAMIDDLLDRPEFAEYWGLKWGDLLRVKSEYPINLWPNAVQAYDRWIRDAIRANKPYDQFARELLTSSGSNFREPPVNFYRAIQGRSPGAIAEAVALTFMGTRVEEWPEDRRAGMAAFFSRVAYKKTDEWKEEIVYSNPATTQTLTAVFPDGSRAQIAPEDDPRRVFADWLIAPDNPWFARAIVNRVWAWLNGRGIVQEPDDIRPDNPELLDYLAKELVTSDYDLKHVYRLILNSRVYQQSSIPRSQDPAAAALFACYPTRRLDAEALMDALSWIGGTGEGYSSPIPEPYTFIPTSERAIQLADGSITSSFLTMFGRPARDTGLESERNNQPSDEQRLYLLNSTEVQRRIENSRRLRRIVMMSRGDRPYLIRQFYLTILSRYPTPEEEATAERSFQGGVNANQAATDLAWALINSKEFLYKH